MSDNKINYKLQQPIPFSGMGALENTEFLAGHFKAANLSDTEKQFIDDLLAEAIKMYKSKDYREAERKVIRGWTNFRRTYSQYFDNLGDLEADAVYFSYLTKKALSEGIVPEAIHNTQLLNLHPYEYFIKCATYLILTKDQSFARHLPESMLEVALSYGNIYKQGFSTEFMANLSSFKANITKQH
ncbi:MAG: hypothetical protein KJ559_04035 [Nanoarchaeota archaeon]|nr:hypothetical protein [Nanoarchaeota archaeon]